MMVRDFHACIGKEARKQCMEKWGGLPDICMASAPLKRSPPRAASSPASKVHCV